MQILSLTTNRDNNWFYSKTVFIVFRLQKHFVYFVGFCFVRRTLFLEVLSALFGTVRTPLDGPQPLRPLRTLTNKTYEYLWILIRKTCLLFNKTKIFITSQDLSHSRLISRRRSPKTTATAIDFYWLLLTLIWFAVHFNIGLMRDECRHSTQSSAQAFTQLSVDFFVQVLTK